jgi:hypothetical protein
MLKSKQPLSALPVVMSIQTLAASLIVGESTGAINLEGPGDFHAAITRMVSQARHSVRIFSQELDHELYDHADFIEQASRIGRTLKNCPINILIKSPDKASRMGHHLVELHRRLPSSVHLRELPKDYEDMNDEFLIVDDIALLKRYNLGYMQGQCELKSIPEAPKKARLFDEIWQRSEPCQELRRLHL